MEITPPVPPPMTEFQFDSACSSPFATAPSSPVRRVGGLSLCYFSAPTSPNRSSQSCIVPYLWDDSPSKPKGGETGDGVSNEFEFEFSARFSEKSFISTADELFHDGKILPLKLPPRLQSPEGGSVPLSPKSPRSPVEQGKRLLRGAFSRSAKDFDPFATALEETRKAEIRRERRAGSSRRTRSLSPLRNNFLSSSIYSEEDMQSLKPTSIHTPTSRGSSKKWRLKDLLFRSASEGREKKIDVKNSFRSTDIGGSGSLRRSPASPHELHYSENRAVSGELRKRTFLPYRRGLLACLGYTSGAVRGLSSLAH